MQCLLNAKAGEEETALPDYQKPLYVLISSDRGLCGGVNSFICKMVKAAIDKDVAAGKEPELLILGEKGWGQMSRTHGKYIIGQMGECWKQPMNYHKSLSL